MKGMECRIDREFPLSIMVRKCFDCFTQWCGETSPLVNSTWTTAFIRYEKL